MGTLRITLTLLNSERSKLYTILAFLSAIGLNQIPEILYQNQTVSANRPSINLPKRRPGASQQASRSAPQGSTSHGSAPVNLTMTTVAKDNKSEMRQFSAGSTISRTSRQAEEEKVEQLKHMNLVFIVFTSAHYVFVLAACV